MSSRFNPKKDRSNSFSGEQTTKERAPSIMSNDQARNKRDDSLGHVNKRGAPVCKPSLFQKHGTNKGDDLCSNFVSDYYSQSDDEDQEQQSGPSGCQNRLQNQSDSTPVQLQYDTMSKHSSDDGAAKLDQQPSALMKKAFGACFDPKFNFTAWIQLRNFTDKKKQFPVRKQATDSNDWSVDSVGAQTQWASSVASNVSSNVKSNASSQKRSNRKKKNSQKKNSDNNSSNHNVMQYPRHEQAPETKNGVVFLDLMWFKTQPCTNKEPHSSKQCMYYHEANKRDRRRVPTFYTSEMCEKIQGGKKECPTGDACIKAHNRIEDFYHPEKYKSKFCQTYPDRLDECEYGNLCGFAHAESELSVPILEKMERDADFYMFHFKTVWCPFSDKDHQRDLCLYAHNWQDYRRPPHLYEYQTHQCTSWETRKNTKTYRDGCRLEYRCGSCHGWKELEYHPMNYKTQECRTPAEGQCPKSHCPYYHKLEEKREVQRNDSRFKLWPRNRGQTQSQTQLYQTHFIREMLAEKSRTQTMKQHPVHQFQYAEQSIYGCGPLSIPIIDPRLVLEIQRFHMPEQCFTRAIASQNGPKPEKKAEEQQFGKLPIRRDGSSILPPNSNDLNQQSQSFVPSFMPPQMHNHSTQVSSTGINSSQNSHQQQMQHLQHLQQQQQLQQLMNMQAYASSQQQQLQQQMQQQQYQPMEPMHFQQQQQQFYQPQFQPPPQQQFQQHLQQPQQQMFAQSHPTQIKTQHQQEMLYQQQESIFMNSQPSKPTPSHFNNGLGASEHANYQQTNFTSQQQQQQQQQYNPIGGYQQDMFRQTNKPNFESQQRQNSSSIFQRAQQPPGFAAQSSDEGSYKYLSSQNNSSGQFNPSQTSYKGPPKWVGPQVGMEAESEYNQDFLDNMFHTSMLEEDDDDDLDENLYDDGKPEYRSKNF